MRCVEEEGGDAEVDGRQAVEDGEGGEGSQCIPRRGGGGGGGGSEGE